MSKTDDDRVSTMIAKKAIACQTGSLLPGQCHNTDHKDHKGHKEKGAGSQNPEARRVCGRRRRRTAKWGQSACDVAINQRSSRRRVGIPRYRRRGHITRQRLKSGAIPPKILNSSRPRRDFRPAGPIRSFALSPVRPIAHSPQRPLLAPGFSLPAPFLCVLWDLSVL